MIAGRFCRNRPGTQGKNGPFPINCGPSLSRNQFSPGVLALSTTSTSSGASISRSGRAVRPRTDAQAKWPARLTCGSPAATARSFDPQYITSLCIDTCLAG